MNKESIISAFFSIFGGLLLVLPFLEALTAVKLNKDLGLIKCMAWLKLLPTDFAWKHKKHIKIKVDLCLKLLFNQTNTHSLVLRQSLLKEHDEEREVGGCQGNGTQRRRSEERDVTGGSARLRREVRSYHGADEEAERECNADESL